MTALIAGTPYMVRNTGYGYEVIRPVLGGGYFTVAGPFFSQQTAEQAAVRLGASRRVTA